MKPFFTHGVARSMHVAPSAWLAVVLSAMAGSASAQLVGGGGGDALSGPPLEPFPWYLPHSDLTPYQFVSDDGRCLQTDYELTHRRVRQLTLAACNEVNSLQKFYVLDYSAQSEVVTDFVPQTDGAPSLGTDANARIVLAGPVDERPGGEYAFVSVNGESLEVMAAHRTRT